MHATAPRELPPSWHDHRHGTSGRDLIIGTNRGEEIFDWEGADVLSNSGADRENRWFRLSSKPPGQGPSINVGECATPREGLNGVLWVLCTLAP